VYGDYILNYFVIIIIITRVTDMFTILCFCLVIRSPLKTCSVKKEYAHYILLNVTSYQRERYLLTNIFGKKFVCTTNKSIEGI
jgi:hypothetical protein